MLVSSPCTCELTHGFLRIVAMNTHQTRRRPPQRLARRSIIVLCGILPSPQQEQSHLSAPKKYSQRQTTVAKRNGKPPTGADLFHIVRQHVSVVSFDEAILWFVSREMVLAKNGGSFPRNHSCQIQSATKTEASPV